MYLSRLQIHRKSKKSMVMKPFNTMIICQLFKEMLRRKIIIRELCIFSKNLGDIAKKLCPGFNYLPKLSTWYLSCVENTGKEIFAKAKKPLCFKPGL